MPYWGMTQYVVHGWHVSYPRCSTTTVARPSCRFAVERYIEHPRFLMFAHFSTLRFLMLGHISTPGLRPLDLMVAGIDPNADECVSIHTGQSLRPSLCLPHFLRARALDG